MYLTTILSYYLFYFLSFYDSAVEAQRLKIIVNDEDPNIDHLYFLQWINSAGTENLFGMLEQPCSDILVHSLRKICSDGNWRHSEEFEQVAAALSVFHYTTAARLQVCLTTIILK